MRRSSLVLVTGLTLFVCTAWAALEGRSAEGGAAAAGSSNRCDKDSCDTADATGRTNTIGTMAGKPAIADIVLPPRGSDGLKGTLIFMHGLGDTGEGWEDAMHMVQQHVPGLKVVLPSAPKIPVSLNGGMRMPAWYDLKGLGARDNETCDGIEVSAERVKAMVAAARAETPTGKVFLGGFSQGGAMSYYTGLQEESALAGIVVLSGYLPCPGTLAEKAKQPKGVPILHCHGDADQVVRHDWAKSSQAKAEEYGYSVEFKTYGGMGHSSSSAEITKVVSFLKTHLQ